VFAGSGLTKDLAVEGAQGIDVVDAGAAHDKFQMPTGSGCAFRIGSVVVNVMKRTVGGVDARSHGLPRVD
jgi:hypothetical protein